MGPRASGSSGITTPPFAASGALALAKVTGGESAGPSSSRLMGGVRMKTTGVGIMVNNGDIDRAMRKLKRTMIVEGIVREQKKRAVGCKQNKESLFHFHHATYV